MEQTKRKVSEMSTAIGDELLRPILETHLFSPSPLGYLGLVSRVPNHPPSFISGQTVSSSKSYLFYYIFILEIYIILSFRSNCRIYLFYKYVICLYMFFSCGIVGSRRINILLKNINEVII